MSDHLYLCPGCADRLFAIPNSLHDPNVVLPCPCGTDIRLWQEKSDVRRDEWEASEYGVSDAWMLTGEPKQLSDAERAEYES